MKFTIEIVLIAILVMLMYYNPAELSVFVSSVLGKIVSLVIISYIAVTYGRNTGLLAAFIFILLMHHEREGLENPPKAPTQKKKDATKLAMNINGKIAPIKVKEPALPLTPAAVVPTPSNSSDKKGKKVLVPKATTRNITEEDRNIKIKGLLNSQEARGQYGGESKGLVGKPEKI